jgi:hypothetical protein
MDYAVNRERIGAAGRRARLIFEADSAAWGIRLRPALLLAAAPVLVAVLVAAAHLVKPLYRFLTAEDSVLEWSQVICVAGAAVLLGLTVRILVQRRDWLWAAILAGGALAAILVVGEEISWGQRLFAIATPEGFQEVNNQGEINLHNVRGVLKPLNFAMMVGAGLGLALPIIVAAARELGRRVPSLAYRVIPPLALVTAFAIPFTYRFWRFIRAGGSSGSYAEAVEFCLYFGLIAFAFLLHRRIAAEGRE